MSAGDVDEKTRECYEQCLQEKCNDEDLMKYAFCSLCCICYCRGKHES